jgi:integration host factor subunit alpha
MSYGKDIICNNISSRAQIKKESSKAFLKAFLRILAENAKTKKVKLPKFGTFFNHCSPERLGRNPKTNEEFVIRKRTKILFRASSSPKNILN